MRHNYNKTALVKRLTPVMEIVDEVEQATNKKEYQTHIETLRCVLQPSGASITANIEGGFGKAFFIMCDISDIEESDRITVDEIEYQVVGFEVFNFGSNPHMEVELRTF